MVKDKLGKSKSGFKETSGNCYNRLQNDKGVTMRRDTDFIDF